MTDTDYATEEWRTISVAPDYAVSNFGRIRRAAPDRLGRNEGLMLKQQVRPDRYFGITLAVKGNLKSFIAHRLVCTAFHGPAPTPKHHAAHRDGTRTNNRADNLRWATPPENFLDNVTNGTVATGGRHGSKTHPGCIPAGDRHYTRRRPDLIIRGIAHVNARLSDQAVAEIRQSSERQRVLAKRFGVSQSLISMIRTGRKRATT